MMDVRAQIVPEGVPQYQAPAPNKVEEGRIFDLGDSGGSNIAANKDSMIAEAFVSLRRQGQPST